MVGRGWAVQRILGALLLVVSLSVWLFLLRTARMHQGALALVPANPESLGTSKPVLLNALQMEVTRALHSAEVSLLAPPNRPSCPKNYVWHGAACQPLLDCSAIAEEVIAHEPLGTGGVKVLSRSVGLEEGW